MDTPEDNKTFDSSKAAQTSAVARLTASIKTRLAGSSSVLGADSPVSLNEHDTGRQLIEAAKVGGVNIHVHHLQMLLVAPLLGDGEWL